VLVSALCERVASKIAVGLNFCLALGQDCNPATKCTNEVITEEQKDHQNFLDQDLETQQIPKLAESERKSVRFSEINSYSGPDEAESVDDQY
jgi:hypothetical protein